MGCQRRQLHRQARQLHRLRVGFPGSCHWMEHYQVTANPLHWLSHQQLWMQQVQQGAHIHRPAAP